MAVLLVNKSKTTLRKESSIDFGNKLRFDSFFLIKIHHFFYSSFSSTNKSIIFILISSLLKLIKADLFLIIQEYNFKIFMKSIGILFLLVLSSPLMAQKIINWENDYQLQLSDFKSPTTQIGQTNIYSLNSGSRVDFAFSMSNAEFMFTKNFNSKIHCFFRQEIASLVAPDSLIAGDLLNFARYQFDLSELYARKLRKKLYEEKGTFSNIKFFQPIYNNIQEEFLKRQTVAMKTTDLGRKKEKLIIMHQEVLMEIKNLEGFCKSCKPPKKRRK